MDEKDIVKDIGFNLIKEFDLDDPIFNYVLDLLIELVQI